jgi:hypothetical protein
VDDGTLEDFLNRANKLVKGCLVEALLLDDLLGTHVSSQADLEEHHGVLVSLRNNSTLEEVAKSRLRHDTQLLH